MKWTFSSFVREVCRADVGLVEGVVAARVTIPFNFSTEGHAFQARDYVFDNEVPGPDTIRFE